jgi:hypothetical protein
MMMMPVIASDCRIAAQVEHPIIVAENRCVGGPTSPISTVDRLRDRGNFTT